MYLRWMVRREAPDLGLWRHLDPADLVMPVDTHVLRIAQLTGLTDRKAANWKTAVEITARLRVFSPSDPVRYDFALAHLGISAGCTGAVSPACEGCAMRPVCRVHAPGRLPTPPRSARARPPRRRAG
jgi:endonuclease III